MHKIITTVAMASIATTAFAQNAHILKGNIKDGDSSEGLPGVTVSVFEAGKTASTITTLTDIDGNFEFTLKPGNYKIVIESMGYQSKEVTDITVAEGASLPTVSVVMSESKSTELNEVVVSSSMKKESVNALFTMQKNAASVSDGISAEAIKRSPDRNTADVLKRVSGTTIQDNKFVIIRGLSDRYNTALVDDAVLPSTEPNRKAFSFDIIPSAVIDNIIITKAGTPDLPADFAGGVINVLTKEVPEENFNNISIGTGVNTVSTFKDFKSGYKSGTDILGFDGGRQLPKNFPTVKEASSFLTPAKSAEYLNMLNNDFSIQTRSALPQVNLQAGLGRVYRMDKGRKFGFFGAINYNHSENIRPNVLRQYDDFNYTDNVYNYSTNLGGVVNMGYYYGKSKIGLKTLYNRNFDDNFMYREGLNIGRNRDIQYYAFDLVQKALFKTTLNGEHQVGSGQSKINWLLSYNYISNNQPDQKKLSYSYDPTQQIYLADMGTLGKANNRMFSKLGESIVNANVNYSKPVNMFEKSTLKTGLFGQYRTRDFSNRYVGVTTQDQDVIRQPIQDLFSPENINKQVYDFRDQTITGDEYSATSSTSGAYAMLDNKFTDKLRLVWGARFEAYKIDLSTPEKKYVDQFWWDVLPSANLTYALTEKTNLRASYFKSLARPELREMALLGYYDYELNATINGNPNLQRTIIHNMDLRYEYFPKAGEIISGSVFYKNFSNPIENQLFGANSAYDITTMNFDNARNIGIEMEIRKKLGFLGNDFLNNFTFYANVALINSKVTFDKTRYINGRASDYRPLAGQSPYMINTSLSYHSPNSKLNLTAMYNVIGQRIYLVGDGRFGDVYEMPRNLLDFQVAYNLSQRSELKLNVKDILSSPYRFYFDQNSDSKFTGSAFKDGVMQADKDWLLQQYKPGTTISLTYSYKF